MKKLLSVLTVICMLAALCTSGVSAAETTAETATAEQGIWLPDIISDHMLLQQGKPICLWGKANPGETVDIKIVANGVTYSEGSAVAKEDRTFKAELPALNPGGPYEIVFTTPTETKTVKDVLMGELWVQCGQSNMTMITRNCVGYADDMVPEKTINDIRLFYNSSATRVEERQENLKGEWKIASRGGVEFYSAVGFTALYTVYNELKIPVGGICNAVSGERMQRLSGPEVPGEPGGTCYNMKVAPITNLNIRGVMWNQGSADRDKSIEDFNQTFNKLISTWRGDFGEPDLPFVFLTQSPALMKYYASWNKSYIMEDWSYARLGQIETYYDNDNTAFFVTTDRAPEPTDKDPLHPYNKKTVGERMGNTALGAVYGKIENWQSPLYKTSARNGKAVDVTLSYSYGAIKTTDAQAPRHFLVAENDGQWKAAKAEIVSENTIRLSSDEVNEINYISYCVERHLYPYTSVEDAVIDTYPDVNVVNGADLPLASFYVQVGEEREEKEFRSFAQIPERKDIEVEKSEADEQTLVNPYHDIAATDAFYENAIVLYNRGIMNGVKVGEFNANTNITRAMLYTILYRIDEKTDKTAVGDTWYSVPVQWAKEIGLCTDDSEESLHEWVKNKEFNDTLFKYLNPDGLDEVEAPSEWLIRNFIIEYGLKDTSNVTRGQAAGSFRKLTD